MNEDDTFRRLKQIPYQELWEGPVLNDEIFTGYIYDPFEQPEIDSLARYGWTELEFKQAYINELLARDGKLSLHDAEWWPQLEDDIRRLQDIEDGR